MRSIIDKFNENENKFNKDAVLEARENKGKINDVLLEHVSFVIDNIDKYQDELIPISFIYSVYLLAEFEDKRLFPLLIKLCENEEFDIYHMIGDAFGDKLNSILVSVYDGDIDSLNKIIENKDLNEYMRDRFLVCYIYFYDNNMIEKEDLKEYLLKLIKLYDYDEDYIYNTILDVIINAHLFDLVEEVKDMFDYDVIDPMIRGGYDSFIDDIFNYNDTLDKFDKISDTVKEMYWWACFNDGDNADVFNEEKMFNALSDFVKKDFEKLNVITDKVGRNDPCPCGSGKKYKKCCIDKKELALPYQAFIEESLNEYPSRKENANEVDIYDLFKEEYIEIDKILYKIFKNKQIPRYIKRDYKLEDKINLDYYKQAYEKIKELLEKEKFATIEEYDKKVSIHYSLYRYFEEYSQLLVKMLRENLYYEKSYTLPRLRELLDLFYNNFDLNNEDEIYFLTKKHDLYYFDDRLDEGIEFFKDKLNNCHDSFKYDVYNMLFDLYMCKYDDITFIQDYIDKEEDEELRISLEELKLEFMNINSNSDYDDYYNGEFDYEY